MTRLPNSLTALAIATSLAAVALVLGSCESTPAPTEAPAKLVVTKRLEPYQCGTIQRLHTLGGVFLASQPAADDFRHARDAGVKTVLNLRAPQELENLGFDEQALVQELGLEYHNVPFKDPAQLTDAVFDVIRELLSDSSRHPILVHCASANRVGAVWLAHRVLDDGLTFEAALAEATTVGLKLPAYTDKARAYIERKKAVGS